MIEVLSLFDGISCGKIALDSLGIESRYFASEIDKFAIKVSEYNYPDIVHLGNVQEIAPSGESWDLLIGGSPCQSFSRAGTLEGFKGTSNLFWEFVRVLNEGSFKYFMLENVVMKQEWMDIITQELCVEPIYIDSKLFSAQSRKRVYWTNIPIDNLPIVESPQVVADILEAQVADRYYLSDSTIDRIKSSRTGGRFITKDTIKSKTILSSYGKLPSDCEYLQDDIGIRKLTPIEFERLQGIPDNYTSLLSNTQRYKTVGNGWNIPTIQFLFRRLKMSNGG